MKGHQGEVKGHQSEGDIKVKVKVKVKVKDIKVKVTSK